jgi:hypothetical protein
MEGPFDDADGAKYVPHETGSKIRPNASMVVLSCSALEIQ